ncbi:GNAT family N-acetyltransferase [Candidatus Thiothrix sp. Deng01]|uniref:GNAT family N-acetyltransferase n=1 Tax=Candidatus Thiothrix phosphatis TaxID=3112415 RepID=A0ABU6CT10_9GAMM|nr:GNAT family N-acetyltransferase [Candidatus Thiothrix sp. Deng01]MEB4589961.1 GNAT family N-acetyltransferase [Candidatus Thiothrix sp. Deng01]
MKIEAFDPARHNRSGFASGNPRLDEYLQRYLSQSVKKSIVQAYVAVDDGGKVLGYYTLSAAHIRHDELPEEAAKKFPRYPIPAALLGRMATDTAARGANLHVGSKLLVHAMKQTLKATGTLGVACMVVDAKPEAVGFYQRFGFMPLKQKDGLRLYLPVETIRKMQQLFAA